MFIDEIKINQLLKVKEPHVIQVREILAKALCLKGLSIEEVAILSQVQNIEPRKDE